MKTDKNLLIDYFYLPKRIISTARNRKAAQEKQCADVAQRKAAIKQIQKEQGCSFFKARQIYLSK